MMRDTTVADVPEASVCCIKSVTCQLSCASSAAWQATQSLPLCEYETSPSGSINSHFIVNLFLEQQYKQLQAQSFIELNAPRLSHKTFSE